MSLLLRRQRSIAMALSCIVVGAVGWIWVAHSAAAGAATASAGTTAQKAAQRDFPGHAVDPQLNANTRSLAEAKDGKHPERLSPLSMPSAFDKAKFEVGPQAYLDVVEPGRVWQSLKPAANVTPLHVKGLNMAQVKAGGSVTLTVTGVPLAPVAFTSFDGGIFENELNSITVRADAKGDAHVTFRATEGTMADVNILSASPLASGQVRFIVHVNVK